MKKIEYSLSEIDQIAHWIVQISASCSIVALTGSLGAGKTTLTGALLRQMGVCEPVVSPTFTYVNIYQLADGRMVYHFDLYRLRTIQEFEQAGFFEYLYQPNSLAVIEWPEILLPVLQDKVCFIDLSSIDDQMRLLEYKIT